MCNITEAWANYVNTKDINKSSLNKEVHRFNKHLAPYWKNINLQDIKVRHILIYKKHLFESNLSPQSVKLCLSLLRRIMNRAIQLELYSGQLPYFEMPVIDNSRIRFLTENEAQILFTALHIKSELWHDIALFALNTGMRASEIFSLHPENINFAQNTITIFETKNKQIRIVPLNATANEIAKKYCTQKMRYLFSEIKIKQASHIFRNVVNETDLNRNITDKRNKIVFHSLRHTFASWLVQKGIPLMVVSNLLGHKGLQMTLRYAHLAPEQGHYAVSLIPNNISNILKSSIFSKS